MFGDLTRRKEIFIEELYALRNENLITNDDCQRIDEAYLIHFSNKAERLQERFSALTEVKQADQLTPQQKSLQKLLNKPSVEPVLKPKHVLTPQEIRDRNITWVLILGVVLVLLSGIVLATSNWAAMDNSIKTVLIAGVGILFFGISILTDKVLKIDKTSFAFWVLGGLSVPIAVLSAGYFELFGHWLSLFGEGKYLLGVVGTSICLPIYSYSVYKYRTRLFIWFSLLALSLDVVFITAAFYPSADVFYFVLILFNSSLLLAVAKLKEVEKISLFIKELPLFSQVNLVISTLFMLVFYSNHIFYSFNLMLSAALYISMVFTEERKEYSYVFSLLVIYGMYQLIENSILFQIEWPAFAFLGFIFLLLANYLRDEEARVKLIFRYVSGIISLLSFIYISYQGLPNQMEGMLFDTNKSTLMLVSYLLISLNYMVLANKTKKQIFSYLAPIFLIVTGHQSFEVIRQYISNFQVGDYYAIYMFVYSTILFLILYYKNRWEALQTLVTSSAIISVLIMLASILIGFNHQQWIILSSLLFLFGIISYLLFNRSKSEVANWVTPVSWFLSLITIYQEISNYIIEGESFYNFPTHLGISVIVIFLLSLIMSKKLVNPFYLLAQLLLPFSVLLTTLYFSLQGIGVFPYIMLANIGVYVFCLFKSQKESERKYFLYALFTTATLTLSLLFYFLKLNDQWQNYVMCLMSMLMGLVWLIVKPDWKNRILYYLIPFSMLGILSLNSIYNSQTKDFMFSVIYIAFTLYLIYRSKISWLNIIPLVLLFQSIYNLSSYNLANRTFYYSDDSIFLILVITFFSLKIAGELLSDHLYKGVENQSIIDNWYSVFIDWYAGASLIALIFMPMFTGFSSSRWYELIAPLLFVYLAYSQIARIEEVYAKKVMITITAISTLVPYYWFLNIIDVPELIDTELKTLPWIVLTLILSKTTWINHKTVMKKIEWFVLTIVALLLLQGSIADSSIQNTLILGVLALVSVIAGMQFKYKSYFIIGSGTLLINVLIQTRALWQSLPWWEYLLIAGLILIAVASLNEMQKNKEGPSFRINKQAILNKFKSWE